MKIDDFKATTPYMVLDKDGNTTVMRVDHTKKIWFSPPNRTMSGKEFFENGFSKNDKITFGKSSSEFPDVDKIPTIKW